MQFKAHKKMAKEITNKDTNAMIVDTYLRIIGERIIYYKSDFGINMYMKIRPQNH